MSRVKDITNNTYGNLKVIGLHEIVPRSGSKSFTTWKCLCICGNIHVVRKSNLLKGATTSCGCAPRPRKTIKEVFINHMMTTYKNRAKKLKIVFDIAKFEFEKLIEQACFYCGSAPTKRVLRRTNGDRIYSANGLDRVDSAEGYIVKNVVPCCATCNMMKNDKTVNEFYAHINKIVNFRNIKCL